MAKVSRIPVFVVDVPDTPGQLAAVAALLAEAGVDIRALCAETAAGTARVRLVTDKPTRAAKALAALGVEVNQEQALRLDLANKPGRLQKSSRKLADAGIDITQLWATAFGGKTATCVFTTSDDPKAIAVLREKKKSTVKE